MYKYLHPSQPIHTNPNFVITTPEVHPQTEVVPNGIGILSARSGAV